MPQYNIPVTVDNQASTGNALVLEDMNVPRTVTLQNPPDYTWTHTDSNNHWHAYSSVNNLPVLPTLDTVRDGSGTLHYCKICQEQVFPATLPGPVDVATNIRPPWAARVTLAALPAGNRVTVRATPAGQTTRFGIAMVDSYTGSGPYVVDLIGEAAISAMKV